MRDLVIRSVALRKYQCTAEDVAYTMNSLRDLGPKVKWGVDVQQVLKEAKGYFGRKHSSYRFAKEQVQRSGMYAYRDRRNRKRDFRRLWITRINAAARLEGMSYSQLIYGLSKAEVEVNRKMLAEIAVSDREAFRRFVELAREGAAA